jgi:KamA family protein
MTKEMKKEYKLITKLEDLACYDELSKRKREKLREVLKRHPMRIPEYYYGLIDFDEENDPIRKLSIPSVDELSSYGEEDTSGESTNTKLPGLQHKYKQTVLVLSTNVCFMYCRHCFRKRMVGYSDEEINRRMEETITYVKEHKEVNNVLITGGDSFTMSNKMIESYLKELTKVEHLDFIRFGTRSLVVYPRRIYRDNELLRILEKYNKKKEIIIVTHFNHLKEITYESSLAIKALKERGIVIRNQAVLLKGINDTPKDLSDLLNGLVKEGIQPYYVFQCRPVKGATHFELPLSRAIEVVDQAREYLNGISKGFKFIMSHKRGKIEIVGKTDKDFIFKFHQNKFDEDKNEVFLRPLDETSKWLDFDLNLIENIT